MADLDQKTADVRQAHYYHSVLWRLLAEVPWLAVTLALAASLFIRLGSLSEGASAADHLFRTVVPATVILGFLFLPMVVLVASGDADLSMGFLAGLVGWIIAILSPKVGLGGAVVVSLLVALTAGLVNGLLVGLAKMKGIVVTFAESFLFSGLILVLSEGKTMAAPEALSPALARSPVIFLLWLLLVMVCAALMKFTPLGRRPKAGDPVQETLGERLVFRGLPFVFSGFLSWVSGILLLGWVGYATIASGAGYAETALLATILGGTAYYAGTGFVLSGAIALFSYILFQTANQAAYLPAAEQKLMQGILLLILLPIAHFYHLGVDWLYRLRAKNR